MLSKELSYWVEVGRGIDDLKPGPQILKEKLKIKPISSEFTYVMIFSEKMRNKMRHNKLFFFSDILTLTFE